MFSRSRFIAVLKDKKLRQEDVSNALSINGSTLYRKMAGISDFTRAEIEKLRELLSLSVKEAEAIFFTDTPTETQEVD